MDGPLNDELRNSKDISLVYVSIPFCETRCHFCCFARAFVNDLFSLQELKSAYLKALKHEIQVKAFYFAAKHGVNLKAVNFGEALRPYLKLRTCRTSLLASQGRSVRRSKT